MRRLILHRLYISILLCCMVLATGCAAPQSPQIHMPQENGFSRIMLEGQPFVFAGQIKKPAGTSETLIVYIEGDGHVVNASGRVSDDPTPHFPVGWLLARQDPAPAVLYLARPGQYNKAFARPEYRDYWTEKRFAPEVVSGMSLAIDAAKQQTGSKKLHLVGFSGGGAVATLLTAKRQDVASLVTVAGLLDHAYWTGENGYPPLTGSLNPADVASQLTHVPQIHFYGANDSRIPPSISARFLLLAKFDNAWRVSVPAGHNKGWEHIWPHLLASQVIPMRGGVY